MRTLDAMEEINAREARRQLSALLDRVEQGEEILLTRRGKPVARLVPPQAEPKALPRLEDFRAAVTVSGRSLSEEVVKARQEERY